MIEYKIAGNKLIKPKTKKKTIHSVFVLRNSATSFSNSFTFSTSTMLMSSSVYHSILSLRLYVDSLLQLVRFRLEIRGQRGEKSLHRQPKSFFHAFDFAVEEKLLSEGCFHQTCELRLLRSLRNGRFFLRFFRRLLNRQVCVFACEPDGVQDNPHSLFDRQTANDDRIHNIIRRKCVFPSVKLDGSSLYLNCFINCRVSFGSKIGGIYFAMLKNVNLAYARRSNPFDVINFNCR